MYKSTSLSLLAVFSCNKFIHVVKIDNVLSPTLFTKGLLLHMLTIVHDLCCVVMAFVLLREVMWDLKFSLEMRYFARIAAG